MEKLINQLKKQLAIDNLLNHLYPYDDPDFMLNPRNFTDSSDDDDNAGAVAITADSGSEDEVEIDPYWTKVRVDELQGIGNPVKILLSDTDSMPDLESVSESEDSVMFSSGCLTGPENEERNLTLFSDEEMLDLVEDMGDDGLTSFDAAMLVNVEGNVEGIQTELYDSGASRHMSPYRDHFENYIPIAPKSITAADKRYFQAIGKGDLRIKIPNGPSTTTILLKDVLHCPDIIIYGTNTCLNRKNHQRRLQGHFPRNNVHDLQSQR